MALLPMAMYGLEVPAGDVAIPSRPDIPAAFRLTMAAIDPSAEPEGEEGAPQRATLKIIRQPLGDDYSDDDSEDFDVDGMDQVFGGDSDSDESEDEEEMNGGPSDPSKSKAARREAARKEIKKLLEGEGMDVDEEDDDEDEKPALTNGVHKSVKAIGKQPASDEDLDDESDLDDDEEGEIEEFVICTLDPSKNYQQPLDITIGDNERVWLKVSGTHSIFLTGNYVEPADGRDGMFDPDSDEEDEYDLPPDADELDESDEDSIDELDDLDDPRITEIEEEAEVVPALIKTKIEKIESKPAVANKNKRPAPESADEDDVEAGAEGLDEMIAKESKVTQPTVNGEQKLSKKQLKKLKKNDGAAAAAPLTAKVEEKKEEAPSSSKSDKKVSFAKELEQGPTPTKDKASDKSSESQKGKPTLGVKTVQGVTIDDRKLGSGQNAKNGDRIGMRYIGKLKDGKVFDSNKKGKPFTFKLGGGDVIKGWEIGVQGMQAGGERRITIPPHLAYGSKKTGEIPPNSTLVFDIKLVDINKGK